MALPAVILLLAIVAAGIAGVLQWRWQGQRPRDQRDLPASPDTTQSLTEYLDMRLGAASSPEERQLIALLEESCKSAERWAASHPNDPGSCHAMAVAEYELNRTQAAEGWWKRATQLDPQFLEGYRWQAYIAMERGDFAAAVDLYQRALAIDPAHVDARLGLSEALVAQGDFTGALKWLGEAPPPLEPAAAPVFLLLGQIHLELQQYRQALECFENAARLMPRAPQPYYGLSNAYARLGEPEKAAEHLRTFQELSRSQEKSRHDSPGATADRDKVRQKAARILVVVGEAAARMDDLPTAEQHWRRATQVDPHNRSSRELLVGIYQSRQQWQEAVALLEQLVSTAPQDLRCRLGLASGYVRLNDLDRAEAALREALRLDPGHPAVSIALAQLLVRENRQLAEAIQLAQQAVASDPTAANYYVLSIALAGAGQRQSAIAAIEEALRQEPGERRWREHYDRLRGPN
ncbi:MAG: tetratricopeptide repeat protein [Pirellulaceae bacterium]